MILYVPFRMYSQISAELHYLLLIWIYLVHLFLDIYLYIQVVCVSFYVKMCLCLLQPGPANWCLPWSSTIVNAVTLAPQWVELPDNITWALQPTVITLIEAVTQWAAPIWSQSGPVWTSRRRCCWVGMGVRPLSSATQGSAICYSLNNAPDSPFCSQPCFPLIAFLIASLSAWRCVLTNWLFSGMTWCNEGHMLGGERGEN